MRHESRAMHPAVFVLLLCALGLHAQEGHAQEDPAYVDSPANNARPDPARADGGGDGPTRRVVAEHAMAGALSPEAEAAAEQARLAEIERMTAAQVEAAYRGQQRGVEMAMRDQPYAGQSYAGPPIGGRSMMEEIGRGRGDGYGFGPVMSPARAPASRAPAGPGASLPRQLGSGLMQDAAGVLDAHARREIYGDGGPVYLPAGTGGY